MKKILFCLCFFCSTASFSQTNNLLKADFGYTSQPETEYGLLGFGAMMEHRITGTASIAGQVNIIDSHWWGTSIRVAPQFTQYFNDELTGLHLGGEVGMSFGSNTVLDLGPSLGYQIAPGFGRVVFDGLFLVGYFKELGQFGNDQGVEFKFQVEVGLSI